MGKPKTNEFKIIITAGIVLLAFAYFAYKREAILPKDVISANGDKRSDGLGAYGNAEPSRLVNGEAGTGAISSSEPQLQAERPTLVPLPPEMEKALNSPPPELPPDLQAQLNAPPPELPEDLRRQLESPPPPLPADLQAQLEGPPPELPEDIKKALQTPPRVVSIDEVNNPEGLSK
ncbi:MAG: hypothetical protein IT291_00480 [Deltaproteobacteria bacterium]|nr:hypothetical protein [Deltaproteobacteria bacterium]